MLPGPEIDGEKAVGKLLSGFPADLLAKAAGIPSGFDFRTGLEEKEEDGFEEMPIFGADGEESAQPVNRAEFLAI